MFLIWGRRSYGRVAVHGDEYAHSLFYHLWYMPLFPTQSVWVVGRGRGFGTRWNLESIVAAYLRMWGPLAALACFVAGALPSVIAGGVLAAFSTYAWLARGVRDHRRSDFNLLAFGTRCEPALMFPEMREAMRTSLDARWAKLGLDRTPDDVAQLGARSLEEAVVAYGLLRLAAVDGRGSHAVANRILTGTYDAPAKGDGPYRDDQVEPIPGAVIEQAQTAAAALHPLRSGASTERWWTFSANTLGITLVVALIALGGIVKRSSTLGGPTRITEAQIAAGLETNDYVEVDCDRIEAYGSLDNDHDAFACRLDDRTLAISARAHTTPSNPITGILFNHTHHHDKWSRYIHDDPSVLTATLDEKSIVLIQAVVIACIAYEVFFVALIGFWIVGRFRRRTSP